MPPPLTTHLPSNSLSTQEEADCRNPPDLRRKSFAAILTGRPPDILNKPIAEHHNHNVLINQRDTERNEKRSFFDGGHQKLIGNFSLYQSRKTRWFDGETMKRLAQPFRFALIGKFSHGYPKMDVLRLKMAAFGLKGDFSIGTLNLKHILIRLTLEEDYTRLWLRQTLFIEGFPMRVFKWTPTFNPKEESSIVPIWVRLPHLPVQFFDKDAMFSIGTMIGTPLRIDEATADLTRPSLARICIEIDLTQPLDKEIALGFNGLIWIQRVEYEKLPKYCSRCSHLGHDQLACFENPNNVPMPANKTEARALNVNEETQPEVGKLPLNNDLRTYLNRKKGKEKQGANIHAKVADNDAFKNDENLSNIRQQKMVDSSAHAHTRASGERNIIVPFQKETTCLEESHVVLHAVGQPMESNKEKESAAKLVENDEVNKEKSDNILHGAHVDLHEENFEHEHTTTTAQLTNIQTALTKENYFANLHDETLMTQQQRRATNSQQQQIFQKTNASFRHAPDIPSHSAYQQVARKVFDKMPQRSSSLNDFSSLEQDMEDTIDDSRELALHRQCQSDDENNLQEMVYNRRSRKQAPPHFPQTNSLETTQQHNVLQVFDKMPQRNCKEIQVFDKMPQRIRDLLDGYKLRYLSNSVSPTVMVSHPEDSVNDQQDLDNTLHKENSFFSVENSDEYFDDSRERQSISDDESDFEEVLSKMTKQRMRKQFPPRTILTRSSKKKVFRIK